MHTLPHQQGVKQKILAMPELTPGMKLQYRCAAMLGQACMELDRDIATTLSMTIAREMREKIGAIERLPNSLYEHGEIPRLCIDQALPVKKKIAAKVEYCRELLRIMRTKQAEEMREWLCPYCREIYSLRIPPKTFQIGAQQ